MTFNVEDYAALAAVLAAIEADRYDDKAELELRRLQEKRTDDGFWLVAQEIILRLRAGLVYDTRRDWHKPNQRGRLPLRGMETAYQLARVELLVPLGREPTGPEIAEHILGSDELRLVADIDGIIVSVDSLLRRRRRERQNRSG